MAAHRQDLTDQKDDQIRELVSNIQQWNGNIAIMQFTPPNTLNMEGEEPKEGLTSMPVELSPPAPLYNHASIQTPHLFSTRRSCCWCEPNLIVTPVKHGVVGPHENITQYQLVRKSKDTGPASKVDCVLGRGEGERGEVNVEVA